MCLFEAAHTFQFVEFHTEVFTCMGIDSSVYGWNEVLQLSL